MSEPTPPTPIREEVWKEIRCPKCGRYLFELPVPAGKGKGTCPRCKITVIRDLAKEAA